jgi:hypothetical protein
VFGFQIEERERRSERSFEQGLDELGAEVDAITLALVDVAGSVHRVLGNDHQVIVLQPALLGPELHIVFSALEQVDEVEYPAQGTDTGGGVHVLVFVLQGARHHHQVDVVRPRVAIHDLLEHREILYEQDIFLVHDRKVQQDPCIGGQ